MISGMRIPDRAIIADEKITRYLLVQRPSDDKSGFLRKAGFTAENHAALRRAIRNLADSNDAIEDGRNEYGVFYRVQGALTGPRAELNVVLIWMQRSVDHEFHFVTLKPLKE